MKKFIISFLLLLPSIVFAQVDYSSEISGREVFPMLRPWKSYPSFAVGDTRKGGSTGSGRTFFLSPYIYVYASNHFDEYNVNTFESLHTSYFISFRYNTLSQSFNSNMHNEGASAEQIVFSPNTNPETLYAFLYDIETCNLYLVDLINKKKVSFLTKDLSSELPEIDVFAPNSKGKSISDVIVIANSKKFIVYDKLPSEGETSVSNIKAESNKINSNSNYDISGRRVKNQTYGRIIIRNDGKKYRVN